MTSDRWREVRANFDRLVDLEAQKRSAHLAALRDTDPEIHEEVVRLLQADAGADDVLERFTPPGAGARSSLRDRIHQDMRVQLDEALGDRYRLEEVLGHGGMAVVFRARNLDTGQAVALKVLEPDVAQIISRKRFLREIRIERRLDHPGIVPALDSGEAGRLLYYLMPFVEGESLHDRIEREGPLPFADGVDVTLQCAAALGYAHEHGVVHRDVKPANILLSQGRARLADFGIARVVGGTGEAALTRSGMRLGTVGYMSPEQAAGRGGVDGRADIYGLGCVLYEALAGEPAFQGSSLRAVVTRQVREDPPILSLVRPEASPALDAVIVRALQPDREDRFATATDLAEALGPM